MDTRYGLCYIQVALTTFLLSLREHSVLFSLTAATRLGAVTKALPDFQRTWYRSLKVSGWLQTPHQVRARMFKLVLRMSNAVTC